MAPLRVDPLENGPRSTHLASTHSGRGRSSCSSRPSTTRRLRLHSLAQVQWDLAAPHSSRCPTICRHHLHSPVRVQWDLVPAHSREGQLQDRALMWPSRKFLLGGRLCNSRSRPHSSSSSSHSRIPAMTPLLSSPLRPPWPVPLPRRAPSPRQLSHPRPNLRPFQPLQPLLQQSQRKAPAPALPPLQICCPPQQPHQPTGAQYHHQSKILPPHQQLICWGGRLQTEDRPLKQLRHCRTCFQARLQPPHHPVGLQRSRRRLLRLLLCRQLTFWAGERPCRQPRLRSLVQRLLRYRMTSFQGWVVHPLLLLLFHLIPPLHHPRPLQALGTLALPANLHP